jgi:hypothetical protein
MAYMEAIRLGGANWMRIEAATSLKGDVAAFSFSRKPAPCCQDAGFTSHCHDSPFQRTCFTTRLDVNQGTGRLVQVQQQHFPGYLAIRSVSLACTVKWGYG